MRKIRPIINLFVLICTIFVNYLANALPFNDKSTGQISDQFDILFKPAGYAFSIWGIIYLSLIVFTIFQVLPSQRHSQFIKKIGPYFLISCFANMLWLVVWHYEFFALSLLVMLILLLSLIKIYTSLEIIESVEKWFVRFPFSIYLGWICVATIVNVNIYLDWIRFDIIEINSIIWYVIMSVIGLAVSFFIAFKRKDIVFTLVILWAYIAIAVNNSGLSQIFFISWGVAFFSVIPFVISGWKNFRSGKQC